MDTNVLYYGDNLVWLRKHDYFPDNSVDLVYLDPPFNSKATYNVLFKEPSGKPSEAQLTAFEDTWHWNEDTQKAFQEIMESEIAPHKVKEFISVLPKFVGTKTDMRAYLVMMCIRLIELHRVLKPTGSIYLHCDPAASHYLKVLLDSIFGIENFRNEVVWKRATTVKGNVGQGARFFDRNTDSIFFYAKVDNNVFNPQYSKYTEKYLEDFYKYIEPDTGRRYRLISMTGPGGASKGNPQYEVMGITRYWRYSEVKMQYLIDAGMVVQPSPGVVPQRKQYLDMGKGVSVQSLWDDIPALHSQAAERLGYPTQKPEGLLERIIKASSNEDDIVLDPFCGCGTAIIASQRLKRKWIGIDITHLAIGTMKWRMEKEFPNLVYTIRGEPADFAGAEQLAKDNKYEFQWWAVSKIKGQPYGNKKKGADTGIDGYKYFMIEPDKTSKAIISVKGGSTSVKDIRDLIGVLEREKAPIGIFLTLQEPTKPMREEALGQGYYQTPLGTKHLKVQILTIKEILEGKMPDIPLAIAPIPMAKPKKKKVKQDSKLL